LIGIPQSRGGVPQRPAVSYLEDLGDAREPLVLFEGGGTGVGVSRNDPVQEDLWNQEILLTEKGSGVLRGDEDRVRLIGIDRWLGGVHLSGESPWRWDPYAQTLKRDAA
jgi:hypothetical protein